MLIVQQIKESFGKEILEVKEFLGEISLEVGKESLIELLTHLKNELLFEVLMDLTGVDYLEPIMRTKVVYWLHNPSTLERARVTTYVLREESIPSVTSLWEGADWYERELFDLFGVGFIGHPQLKRILMPDNWKGHPLRKDYPLTEEPVEFKNGIMSKVPSQIIPHFKG